MIPAFKSILIGHLYEEGDPFASLTIPDGMVRVDQIHVTILSSELDKDTRKILKGKDLSILSPMPTVTFGAPYVASNSDTGKQSLVCDCNEQAEIRAWVESAVAALGIAVTLNPERVYHVSVANRTGSQFDSVPDPWNHRS